MGRPFDWARGRPLDSARGRLGAMRGAGMVLWTAGALGQVAEKEPLLKGLTNVVQAGGKIPPTPLTSDQQQQALDAVISRFPNVDSHAMMGYIHEHFPDVMQRSWSCGTCWRRPLR